MIIIIIIIIMISFEICIKANRISQFSFQKVSKNYTWSCSCGKTSSSHCNYDAITLDFNKGGCSLFTVYKQNTMRICLSMNMKLS